MPSMSGELVQLVERGGWVMIPLLVLSVISLTLIVERTIFWLVTHRASRIRRLEAVTDLLRKGDVAATRKKLRGDRSPYARVILALLDDGTSDAVAIEAVEGQRPVIDRFMVTLSTIITAAPLLGILGTVIGIIRSFNLLGVEDVMTDPRAVSVGIAQALITTALGLVVALVTLFPYMIFRAQSERAVGRLESVIASAQLGADRTFDGRGDRRGDRVAGRDAGGDGRPAETTPST
ncbi:MAG: MotA/TolQ/ExbB proton channel family protein [Phycisphaerales bacterium]|nr:MotA/TolQ/ExbB proton channel family protein [Phycisphaerales bacterium]